ncbi:hypothetical protein B0H13DRAFT_1852934 [Mycena leptocephala]|nr:hypothetical protein B0H13DRAFT_1852934 [Mycena leptocephala]
MLLRRLFIESWSLFETDRTGAHGSLGALSTAKPKSPKSNTRKEKLFLPQSLKHALCPQAGIAIAAASNRFLTPTLTPTLPAASQPVSPYGPGHLVPTLGTGPIADSVLKVAYSLRAACVTAEPDMPAPSRLSASPRATKFTHVAYNQHMAPMATAVGWDTAEKDARRAGNLVDGGRDGEYEWPLLPSPTSHTKSRPPQCRSLGPLHYLASCDSTQRSALQADDLNVRIESLFQSKFRVNSTFHHANEVFRRLRCFGSAADITHGRNPLDKCGEAQIAVSATVEHYYATLSSALRKSRSESKAKELSAVSHSSSLRLSLPFDVSALPL